VSDAQAIPENLFSYSDKTTAANAELQQWISMHLTPAIRNYQETARDFGNNIDDLTAPNTGTINVDALRVLLPMDETDKLVRAVGQAFLDAGDKGMGSVQFPSDPHYDPNPTGDRIPYAIVTTSNSLINDNVAAQLNRQSQQAGTELAAYVGSHGIDDHVLQEIQEHQGDPAFLLAFFSHISKFEIEQLILLEYGGKGLPADAGNHVSNVAQAFATLFLTGPNSTTRAVADYMAGMPGAPSPQFEQAFVNDLKANHKAALGFIDSLSDDDMNEITQNYVNGGHVVWGGPVSSYDLMAIASSAMLACTPEQANLLYARITGPNGFLADVENLGTPDLNTLLPLFGSFLSNYVAIELGPPNPGEDPADWAIQVGKFLHDNLRPFIAFINQKYGQGGQISSVTDSTLIALVFTGLTAPISGPWAIAAGLGTDFLEDTLLPILQNHFTPATDPASGADVLRQSLSVTAQLFVAMQLAMQHRLLVNGHPATAAQIQQMLVKVGNLLTAGRQGDADSYLDKQGWTVSGNGGNDLSAVMSVAGIQVYPAG
jgi:hypothetical protein